MIEAIKSWILQLTGAALLSAAAMTLLPSGRVKSAAKVVCGVVCLLALLSIVRDFDFPDYSSRLAAYREQGAELAGEAAENSDRLRRTIIEQECEAYILDKGAEAGCRLENVEVTAKWDPEGFWRPVSAQLTGSRNAGGGSLEYYIEAGLGIPAGEVTWSAKDEG